MTDFLLDIYNDLTFENGDLAVGFVDDQNQALLLFSDKGDWKESPTVCVGVSRWLKDNDGEGLLGEIKKEFEKDGMTVVKLELTEQNLNINANY